MPLSQRHSSRSLRRTKSVTSNIIRDTRANENLRPSPEIARQQALAAAHKAFGCRHIRAGNATIMVDNSGEKPSLRRSQSVRFTGPTAVRHLQPSITRRQAPRWVEIDDLRPVSAVAQLGDSPSQHSQSGVTALPQLRKLSNPLSSFRRLRKTKSMLSPRNNASKYFSHANSSPLANSSLRSTPGTDSAKRFPTGFTPGRAPPTAEELLLRLPNPYQSTYNQADAIQLARDEYLKQLEAQGIQERPSFSSVNTRRPPAKVFRRTVRSSSTNSYGNAVGSETSQPPPPESKAALKGRKVSDSIKGKLRRMFRGSSQSSLPSQQVSATREHYDRASPTTADESCKKSCIPMPPREMVDRNSSRTPSPAYLPGHASQCDGDTAGSLRSKTSTESLKTKSRVTSWGNSTISRDIPSRCGPQPPISDGNRLSVIQENLPHQPSSSANKRKGLAYAAFRKPLRQGRVHEPVDPEVMITALKQRIAERTRSQDEPPDQETKAPASMARSRTSMSQRSHVSTIRKLNASDEQLDVPQISRLKSDRNFDVEANEADDVFQPEKSLPANHKRRNPAQTSMRRTLWWARRDHRKQEALSFLARASTRSTATVLSRTWLKQPFK